MTEETLLQRLVSNKKAKDILSDLKDLDETVPEDTDPEEIQRWEIALPFGLDDIPFMIDKLEEVVDVGE